MSEEEEEEEEEEADDDDGCDDDDEEEVGGWWERDTCHRLSTKSRAKTWTLSLLMLAFALIRAI